MLAAPASPPTQTSEISYLPDLVITISVPSLWNLSHRSFWSSVTLGSSLTLSSSGIGTLGGRPAKGKPGRRGKIPPLGTPPAGVLKLLVGPRGGKPGGRWGGPPAPPWGGGGRSPGKPKSGLGAKLGINGAENAIVALQGDMSHTDHWEPLWCVLSLPRSGLFWQGITINVCGGAAVTAGVSSVTAPHREGLTLGLRPQCWPGRHQPSPATPDRRDKSAAIATTRSGSSTESDGSPHRRHHSRLPAAPSAVLSLSSVQSGGQSAESSEKIINNPRLSQKADRQTGWQVWWQSLPVWVTLT